MVISRLLTSALLLGSLFGASTPVILAATSRMQVAQSVWRRHVSQAGGFSILFDTAGETLLNKGLARSKLHRMTE